MDILTKISMERKLFKIQGNTQKSFKKNDKISKNAYIKFIL